MNGSCLNGCDVGVYGDKCDIGKLSNLPNFCRVLGWTNRIKNIIEKEMTFYIENRIYISYTKNMLKYNTSCSGHIT